MAKIPDASQTPLAIPNAPGLARYGVNSAADEGQIIASAGAGEEQVGAIEKNTFNQLGEATNQFNTALKVNQDRINGLRVEDAFTKFRNTQIDLTNGDKGFKKVQGGDAISQPLLTDYSKQLADNADAIQGTLSNDDQKQAFMARANLAGVQFKNDILEHVAQQSNVYAKDMYEGTVSTETRAAAASYTDPAAVGFSLARIDNAVKTMAERGGWPKEMVDSTMQVDHGRVHSAVVGQMLANNDFVGAQQYFDKNRADIDPATAKIVEKAVEDGTQKQLTNTYNSGFLAARNDPKSLDDLQTQVTKDGQLDDTRKNMLLGRIQGRIDLLDRRGVAMQTAQEHVIQQQINQVNAITLAGFEPSDEQMAPLIQAAKGTALEPQVDQMVQTANATRQFRLQTPAQQEVTLTGMEAQMRAHPEKFDVTMLQKFTSIHSGQQQALKDDPVSFAVRQGLVEPDDGSALPLDLRDPSKLGTQLAARFTLARNMSTQYGTPMKPLTTQEVTTLKNALGTAPADQKSTYFAALSHASGNDLQGYKAIMAQIAPDDPVTAIAGVYAGRGYQPADAGVQIDPGHARSVSDLILTGQAILHPNRKEDGSPDKGKVWPMPQDAQMQQLFASNVGDAFAGMPKAQSDHYQVAQSIYAALSADAGDSSGVLDSKRWDNAIQLATGGVQRWNGQNLVAPYGYTSGQFKDGLRKRVDYAVGTGTLADGMTASRMMDMPLSNIGDGRYVMRAGNGVLVDKTNKPVIIDFNNIPGYQGVDQEPAKAGALKPPKAASVIDSGEPLSGAPLHKQNIAAINQEISRTKDVRARGILMRELASEQQLLAQTGGGTQ